MSQQFLLRMNDSGGNDIFHWRVTCLHLFGSLETCEHGMRVDLSFREHGVS